MMKAPRADPSRVASPFMTRVKVNFSFRYSAYSNFAFHDHTLVECCASTMEDDLDTALNPQSYSTVDPEVRAYVYSLVSAVQPTLHGTLPPIANISL